MLNLRVARVVFLGGIALVGATLGCEAQTTVVTTIVVPSSVPSSARDPSRIHVQIQRAAGFTEKLHVAGGRCPSFDPTTPASSEGRVESSPRGFALVQRAIPTVPEFCLAAWLDANGNGSLDAGDFASQLAKPYPAQESTFFGSNRYASPDVELAPVPSR
jgi:hypothetical protein